MMNSIKSIFTNKDGKIQILPRIDYILLLAVIILIIPIFYELSEIMTIFLLLIGILGVTIWCLKQILDPDTKMLEFTSWCILAILMVGAIYGGYYIFPIFFK
jgi:hypothetical protein